MIGHGRGVLTAPRVAALLLLFLGTALNTPELALARSRPMPQIVDGANGGNEHFYFLPPLVRRRPKPNGEFDPAVSVVVLICELNIESDQCAEPPLAAFSTQAKKKHNDDGSSDDSSSGKGQKRIRVKRRGEYYSVVWRTRRAKIDPGKVYRISVAVGGGLELGHADLQVRRRSVRIRFRIEEGALELARTLELTLDEEAWVSAELSSEGGTLETIDLKGIIYTLEVPPDALLDPATITLTPVKSIKGLAPSGPLVAAAHFEPEGLLLFKPATLTIDLPPEVDTEGLVGFGYLGAGESFHLQFAPVSGSTVSFSVTHFSGNGVKEASETDCDIVGPFNSEADRARQRIECVLRRADVFDLSEQDLKEIEDALEDWFTFDVERSLIDARKCFETPECATAFVLESGTNLFVEWDAYTQTLEGFLQDSRRIDALRTTGRKRIGEAFTAAIEREDKACIEAKTIAAKTPIFATLVRFEVMIQLLGFPELADLIPQIPDDVCDGHLGVALVELNPILVRFEVEDTEELTATLKNKQGLSFEVDGSNYSVKWSNSKPEVATLVASRSTASVTGKSGGITTITAVSDSFLNLESDSPIQDTTEVIVNDIDLALNGRGAFTGKRTIQSDTVEIVDCRKISITVTASGFGALDWTRVGVKTQLFSLVGDPLTSPQFANADGFFTAGLIEADETQTVNHGNIFRFTFGSSEIVKAFRGEMRLEYTMGREERSASFGFVCDAAASIEFDPPDVVIEPGETVRLNETVKNAQGLILDDIPLAWSSSDEAVATVDETGLVTGVGRGIATITASTVGGVTGTAEIEVTGGDKIAFLTGRDGNFEIYVMNADGSGQTNLTNNPSPDGPPAWSPDGTRIAFMSRRDGNFEIYVMNADGSGQTNLTSNPSTDGAPAWSPDGNRIAFASRRDGNQEIYVMNADGSGQTNLTNNPSFDGPPAWSPDGSRIAFTSSRDSNGTIHVMNADGSGQINLTNRPVETHFNPAWSPDGTRIAFRSLDPQRGQHDISVVNADGSGRTNLTNNLARNSRPRWSPDGSRIAFTSFQDGNLEIYVMNADGSGQTNLTNHPATHDSHAWSPDGSRIAFRSNRDGNFEIHVMNADGSGVTNLTNNPATDNSAAWSPARR